METSRTSKIALLIKGMQMPTAGLQPLVSVGIMPTDEIALIDERRMVNEPLVYTIHHGTEHLCYTLYDNKVRPYGSSRQGLLVISIAIPRTQCLSGNLSPYTILQEVYHTFVAIHMFANPDGSHIFKEGDYDRSIIMGVLSKYRLEGCYTPYVPMNHTGGTAVVRVDSDKELAQLMLDSQYPEFRQFKRIEIGRLCAPTVSIEIPRIIQYKVVLNGKPTKCALVRDTDRFVCAQYLPNNKHYDYPQVTFTLHELLQAPNHRLWDGLVVLKGETIYCDIEVKPKSFTLNARLLTTDDFIDNEIELIRRSMSDGTLSVWLGDTNISRGFVDNTPILVSGEQIDKKIGIKNAKVYPYFSFKIEKREDEICLIVSKKSSSVPQPLPEPKKKQEDSEEGPNDNEEKKKSIWFKMMFIVSGFLIGLSIGILGTYSITNREDYIDWLQQQVNENRTDNEILIKEVENLKKQLDEAKIKEPTDTIAKPEPPQKKPVNPDLTVDYKSQIIELFNERDYYRLNNVLTMAVKAKQITQEQREKISIFWWNTTSSGDKYNKIQQRKIMDYLMRKNFHSVEEIVHAGSELEKILK